MTRKSWKKGEFVPLLPIDRLILEAMPAHGKMFAGLYPEAVSFRDFHPPSLAEADRDVVLSRLRSMVYFDLLSASVVPRSNSRTGYQRSALGEKYLAEWTKGGE